MNIDEKENYYENPDSIHSELIGIYSNTREIVIGNEAIMEMQKPLQKNGQRISTLLELQPYETSIYGIHFSFECMHRELERQELAESESNLPESSIDLSSFNRDQQDRYYDVVIANLNERQNQSMLEIDHLNQYYLELKQKEDQTIRLQALRMAETFQSEPEHFYKWLKSIKSSAIDMSYLIIQNPDAPTLNDFKQITQAINDARKNIPDLALKILNSAPPFPEEEL